MTEQIKKQSKYAQKRKGLCTPEHDPNRRPSWMMREEPVTFTREIKVQPMKSKGDEL